MKKSVYLAGSAVIVLTTVGLSPITARAQDTSNGTGLETVVVSAEKRDTPLQTTPLPVSVLDADNLTQTHEFLLSDYYSSIPGFVATPNIEGSQMLSIRGITTGSFGPPTVGVTIDDLPFGISGGRGAGDYVPDLDPGDLARIEVLRGPQGTLYGANSLGGLVKYVTVDPSTAGFSGRMEGGYSSIYNGSEPGFSLRGSLNVPVTDDFAIRVSAYARQDPGYINNPGICGDAPYSVACAPIRGVNDGEAYGGRIAAIWTPIPDLTIKVSALYQIDKTDGLSEVSHDPGLGDLQQDYIAGLGGVTSGIEAYSATINYQLGGITITSLSGYNAHKLESPFDFTPFFGGLTANGVSGTTFTGLGVSGTALFNHDHDYAFNQELRATGSYGDFLDWIVGGFYTHQYASNVQFSEGINNATGAQLQQLSIYTYPDYYDEYAGFANLTFHLDDRIDVQVGGRESYNSTKEFGAASGVYSLLLNGSDPFNPPPEKQAASSFTYSFSPSYKLSSDLFLYARVATGYRPGSPNENRPDLPAQDPDTTTNYEIGAKGDFFDNKLTFDASLYYINWKNIQLSFVNGNSVSYDYNGSEAKSEGAELSVEARPLEGLTLSGWLTYDNAVLTQAFPSGSVTVGLPGNWLPFTPQFSAYANAEEDFPIWNGAVGYIGGALSYVGSREGTFEATPERQLYPEYTKFDLRAGVRIETWTVGIYANNVTDSRALLDGGIGYVMPNAYVVIQPRVVGVDLTKKF